MKTDSHYKMNGAMKRLLSTDRKWKKLMVDADATFKKSTWMVMSYEVMTNGRHKDMQRVY